MISREVGHSRSWSQELILGSIHHASINHCHLFECFHNCNSLVRRSHQGISCFIIFLKSFNVLKSVSSNSKASQILDRIITYLVLTSIRKSRNVQWPHVHVLVNSYVTSSCSKLYWPVARHLWTAKKRNSKLLRHNNLWIKKQVFETLWKHP